MVKKKAILKSIWSEYDKDTGLYTFMERQEYINS